MPRTPLQPGPETGHYHATLGVDEATVEDLAGLGGPPSGAAGGQLSGTYPNPSVASSHSGTTHAAAQAAAEATAAAALSGHASDTTNIHGISDTAAIPVLPIEQSDVTGLVDVLAATATLPIAQSDVTDLPETFGEITTALDTKAELPIAQADVTDLVDDIAAFQQTTEDLGIHVLAEEAHGLLKAVVDVTAEQMLTLFSAPPEIIPAPGVGNVVVVLNALAELAFGTEAYPLASLVLAYDDASGDSAVGLSGELLASTVSAVALAGPAVATAIPLTAVANKPIVVSADSDAGDVGAITTSSLGDGGADYAEDDEFTVDGGEGDATGVVDTVDGGGAVLTYHLTSFGHGYSVVPGAIANGGTGTGLTINVDSITPQGDGTLRVTVWYRIVELA